MSASGIFPISTIFVKVDVIIHPHKSYCLKISIMVFCKHAKFTPLKIFWSQGPSPTMGRPSQEVRRPCGLPTRGGNNQGVSVAKQLCVSRFPKQFLFMGSIFLLEKVGGEMPKQIL